MRGPNGPRMFLKSGRLPRGTLDVHDVKNAHSYREHGGDPDEPRVGGFIHKNMLPRHTISTLT